MEQTRSGKDSAAQPDDAQRSGYEHARACFSWGAVRSELDGLPAGTGLNIAHETVDRHALGPRREQPALCLLGRDGSTRVCTYSQLSKLTNRFANVLEGLGIGKGDRVFTLLGRGLSLYVAALGAMKRGSVFAPLFPAFGPEPIEARLAIGEGKVLVTTMELYERKVAAIRAALPWLEQVWLTELPEGTRPPPGTRDLGALLSQASATFEIAATAPEDLAILHFTSGTTGRPKGALHVHEAVLAHHVSARLALGLRPEDVFWCTADPGWVTGTSYGIVAPLSVGATVLVDAQDFDPERWCRTLAEHRVSVWYTAPTAVRMMMRAGAALARRYEAPVLRLLASVGEPLSADAVLWGREAFGLPFHDTWWQTETGAIMIANLPGMEVRPGSMGLPLPGVEAALVRRREGGGVDPIDRPGAVGEIALRSGWPSMFRGYLGDEAQYRRCFADGWYLSGDLARTDEDGYFWFLGRSDDVIKSSGHLIGPFEVESALMGHPAVLEAGVIGRPDPVAGEVVKAFVCTRPGYIPSESLRREILAHARRRLGPAVAPKEIDFRTSLPKTRSGKILRRVLRVEEGGAGSGDLSTLEDETSSGGR